jgi:hypothetical protein
LFSFDLKSDHFTILTFDYYKAIIFKLDKNRITALFKVETDIIATIVASPIYRALILLIMDVKTFKNDVLLIDNFLYQSGP